MAIESIALIPSGVKATKVYSQLPVDGGGDFTFDRGTSTDQTRVNSNGLIEDVAVDVPRLDYSDGSCPSLLLEPATTNLIPYSEDFNQHSILGGSITSDNIISPDGGLNSDTFVEDTSNSQHRIREDISVSAGTYTMSVFVKGTDRFISLYPQSAGSAYAVFDIENATITKTGGSDYVDSKIEDYGNGWYRCILTYDVIAGTSFLHIYLSDKGTGAAAEAPTYTGDGSEMNFYGLQLEKQSYATSYVPSLGTSGVRAAETASKTGLSSYINSTEGVLYAEISALANDSVEKRMGLQDAGTYDAVRITYTPTSNSITGVVYNNGASQCNLVYIVPNRAEFHKIALKYKENDFSMYVDGVLVASHNSGTTFSVGALDEFAFDVNGGSRWYGKCKNLRVYKEALSDLELATLTGFGSFSEMASYLSYS